MRKNEANEPGIVSRVTEITWEGAYKLMRGIVGSSPDNEEGVPVKFGFSSVRKDIKALFAALEGNMVSFGKPADGQNKKKEKKL